MGCGYLVNHSINDYDDDCLFHSNNTYVFYMQVGYNIIDIVMSYVSFEFEYYFNNLMLHDYDFLK